MILVVDGDILLVGITIEVMKVTVGSWQNKGEEGLVFGFAVVERRGFEGWERE